MADLNVSTFASEQEILYIRTRSLVAVIVFNISIIKRRLFQLYNRKNVMSSCVSLFIISLTKT